MVSLALVAVNLPPPVKADATPPILSVGDFWSYEMQSTIVVDTIALSLVGTLRTEIEAEENYTANDVEYETHRVEVSGSGTAGILNVTGTWTTSGAVYQRRSDFALVQSAQTTQFYLRAPGGTLTFSEIREITANPPASPYEFPLSVGKAWIASVSQTTKVTSWSSLDPTPVVNTTTTLLSRTYSVLRTEKVTTSAGSFEAYVIRSSDAQESSDDYYSPNVGNTVRALATEAGGSSTNLLLKEYKAWPFRGSSTVSNGAQTMTVDIKTNVLFENLTQGSTSISFDVEGLSGVTGKAALEVPRALNNTILKVYVDSQLVNATVSRNSTHYHLSFTFAMSSHAITLVFAKATTPPPSQTSDLIGPPILAGIAVAIIAGIVAVLLLVRRKKVVPEAPAAPPVPPEGAPPPGPSQPEGQPPLETPPPEGPSGQPS